MARIKTSEEVRNHDSRRSGNGLRSIASREAKQSISGSILITSMLLGLLVLIPSPSAAVSAGTPRIRLHVMLSSDTPAYRSASQELRAALSGFSLRVEAGSLESWLQRRGRTTIAGRADLFIAIGSPAAEYLLTQLPEDARLVYCLVADPRRLGLDKREKTWGVSTRVSSADLVEMLTSALPGEQRVGVLHSPTEQGRAKVDELKNLIPDNWGIEAQEAVEREFVTSLDTLLQQEPTILVALPDHAVFTRNSIGVLLREAYRARTPVLGYSKRFVLAGALLGTTVDPNQQGRRAGELARLVITSGAEPPLALHESASPTPYLNLAVLDLLDIDLKSGFQERKDLRRVNSEVRQ